MGLLSQRLRQIARYNEFKKKGICTRCCQRKSVKNYMCIACWKKHKVYQKIKYKYIKSKYAKKSKKVVYLILF